MSAFFLFFYRRPGPRAACPAEGRRRLWFATLRRTPTANAEELDRIGGRRRKGLGGGAPLAAFRSTKALGVRRRHAPRYRETLHRRPGLERHVFAEGRIGSISASPTLKMALYRHRRRHAHCAGIAVPVLKVTASPRRSFRVPARPYPRDGHAVGDAEMPIIVSKT